MDWLLLPALLAAVAAFVWYAIAWMALPHHHGDFKSVGRASPVDAAMKAANLPPGLYIHPHYKDYPGGMKDPELVARQKQGGTFWMVVTKGCGMGGKTFLFGFVLNLLEAATLACLLRSARLEVVGLSEKVLFAAGIGLLVRGSTYASQSIWMGSPWRYTVTNAFDGVVGYGLMGLVIHLVG